MPLPPTKTPRTSSALAKGKRGPGQALRTYLLGGDLPAPAPALLPPLDAYGVPDPEALPLPLFTPAQGGAPHELRDAAGDPSGSRRPFRRELQQPGGGVGEPRPAGAHTLSLADPSLCPLRMPTSVVATAFREPRKFPWWASHPRFDDALVRCPPASSQLEGPDGDDPTTAWRGSTAVSDNWRREPAASLVYDCRVTQTSSLLKLPPLLWEGHVGSRTLRSLPSPGPGDHSGQQDPEPRGLCLVQTTPKWEGDQHQPNNRCAAHRNGQALAPLGRAGRACGTLQASLRGPARTLPGAPPADRAKPTPPPHTCRQPRLLRAHSYPPGGLCLPHNRGTPCWAKFQAPPATASLSHVSPQRAPRPRWGAQRLGGPPPPPPPPPKRPTHQPPQLSLRAPPQSTSPSRAPAADPRPPASRASSPLPWLRARYHASGPHSLLFSARPSDALQCRLHEFPPWPQLPELGNPEAPSQPRA
ncbi:nascent polypeptide-associated complex subunit alpha, muscle-specific form-like [Enhydra lutris kenyoni]|uniref:Nascent polypeptide-associated complex subunit alpha, muscle-specific form-like n=1 Tax=Enhydra lutris kenyoni TaxID=391180 RepID=A0A2Y9KGW0_ENHLU|nr:nascent polypeptide-associated complex subunit alpha, muscle-specific form-like [Enhydra lutris kenyoni]